MPDVNTIAILSPGEMGHAVGRVLGEHGKDVITCLEGRSRRTRELAAVAGFRDCPTLEELVSEADLVMSILVPAESVPLARRVAEAMRGAGVSKPFAECNPVSPAVAREMEGIITGAGGTYIDGSIIGGPPDGQREMTRFYVSGVETAPVEALDGLGTCVRPIGDAVGRAKAIKMCYAGTTKGTTALFAAVLTVAELLGVSDELREEFASSQPDILRRTQGVRRTPAVARRWIAEMEEIAATFASAGVTPRFHQGAAEVYRMVGSSSIGNETPETLDPDRTLEEVIGAFAEMLETGAREG